MAKKSTPVPGLSFSWKRALDNAAEAAGCPTDGHPHLEGRNGEEDRECHPKDAVGEEVRCRFVQRTDNFIKFCRKSIWKGRFNFYSCRFRLWFLNRQGL